MNNADLKALIDKREANIQKLKNYFDAGKTYDEKVVSKVIKQIQDAEEKLISFGIELNETINEQGIFVENNKQNENTDNNSDLEVIVIDGSDDNDNNNDNSNDSQDSQDDGNTSKSSTSKKAIPTRKLRDENTPSKPEISKIGVTIKETVKAKVDILADDNNMKPNEVVNDLLERIFDGKNFNVQIEKKDKTKVTSFNIPKAMDKAMTRISKSTGVPKTEVFNRLLEESLKEFFK